VVRSTGARTLAVPARGAHGPDGACRVRLRPARRGSYAPPVSAPSGRIRVPLFPLSTVVLFPDADCPLHVFEPRYRQMTRAALAGEGRIGMVTVRPEHVGDMAGEPAVFPVGCLGRIVRSEELGDGRFNIVLHGTTRFRVAREIPRAGERLYRLAEVEPLTDDATDPDRTHALRRRISDAFARLVRRVAPDRARELAPERFADVGDGVFLAVLVQMLNLPPLERQGLLEAGGDAARLEALEGILHFQLAGLGLGDEGGPGVVH
jgi:Lon protease-like protein